MPNETDTFVFPLEVPEFYTRMSLRKYERPKPGSTLTPTFQTYIRLPIPQQLIDSFNISVSGNNMELLGNISNAPAQLAAAGRSLSEDFAAAKGGELRVSIALAVHIHILIHMRMHAFNRGFKEPILNGRTPHYPFR